MSCATATMHTDPPWAHTLAPLQCGSLERTLSRTSALDARHGTPPRLHKPPQATRYASHLRRPLVKPHQPSSASSSLISLIHPANVTSPVLLQPRLHPARAARVPLEVAAGSCHWKLATGSCHWKLPLEIAAGGSPPEAHLLSCRAPQAPELLNSRAPARGGPWPAAP